MSINNTTAAEVAAEAGTDLDSVKRRIAKLLAIAEDGRANANEASAAAGMAERLMRKFQIDNVDLVTAQLQSGAAEFFANEDVGSSMNPDGRSENASGWVGQLAVSVATLHDCQVRYVTTHKHGKTLRFSGYASDAQMARFTYGYLVQTMAQSSRDFLRVNEGARRSDGESFRRGFMVSVRALLKRALEAKQAELQVESNGRALVLVKDDAVAKHFGAIKYVKSGKTNTRGQAFADGFERGASVDVNRRGLSTGAAAVQIA